MNAYEVVRGIGMTWVRVYTGGMPRAQRERRIGEIQSDLWEQHTAADFRDASLVAGRFLRGVPADIAWRFEMSMHADTDDDLMDTWPGLAAVLIVLAVGVTSLVYAVLHTFGYFGHSRLYAFIQVGLLIGSLVLLRGLSMTRESPRAGAAVVLVAGLAMAFLWMFMPPIAFAILLVVAYGLKRAWDTAHASQATARERASPGHDPPGP